LGIVRILVALVVISVVIIFHEFGHFLLARVNGVEVVEFSLGMGPRILSHQGKKTRYSLKLLPIGGACQMKGEDENNDEEGTFNSKGVWQRISIVFAGPLFNFILAFLFAVIIIGSIGVDKCYVTSVTDDVAEQVSLEVGDEIIAFNGHSIGVGRELYLYESLDGISKEPFTITYVRDGKEYEVTINPVEDQRYYLGIKYAATAADAEPEPAELTDIIDGSAAEKAGLKVGDIITAVNGASISSGNELSTYLSEHPLDGSEVKVTYERKGKEYTISLTPNYSSLYDYGFNYNTYYREKVGVGGTLKYSALELRYWIRATGKSLLYMVRGKASSEDIGGPVRVVSEMSNVMEESYTTDGFFYAFLNMLNWAILLSANLGVMNLLPIPALDGGRLLFLLIEAIRGKKLPPEKEGVIHLIGFILLMILMAFIFFNDIKNVFF